jgi:hypothetical protein
MRIKGPAKAFVFSFPAKSRTSDMKSDISFGQDQYCMLIGSVSFFFFSFADWILYYDTICDTELIIFFLLFSKGFPCHLCS